MTQKVYILDVDGVVADFTSYMLKLVGSNKTLADIVDWDIFGFITPEEKKHALELLSTQAFWENQPLISGAVEGVAAIRSAGHKVLWCTSPWLDCVGWAYARRRWIQRYFDAASNDIIIAETKSILRGDVFIDDRPKHVTAWAAANPSGVAWLYDAPYNQELYSAHRMSWNVEPRDWLVT